MRRSFLSIILVTAGLGLLLASLGPWLAAATPARAQAQPRPTLTPVPSATPRATRHHKQQPAATGRIAGTVIDLTTGAPAPGVAVQVGDAVITTDANGNYDRAGLAAGRYVVALALGAEQGVAAQELITIELGADAMVVQHLAFRSPPAATVATAPSAAAAPASLPATGAATSGGWPLALLGMVLLLGGGAARLRR